MWWRQRVRCGLGKLDVVWVQVLRHVQCIFVSKKNGMWHDTIDEQKIPKHERFSNGFQRKIDGWKKVLTDPGSGLG